MSLATILKGAMRPQASDPSAASDASGLLATHTPEGATTNPYLNARRTWNAHTGSVVSSRQMWQIAGLLCLLITLASVGGMTYIGAQSKFVPFMVPVDNLAQAGAR
jgi:type IV secretory pathway TrbF-like protein